MAGVVGNQAFDEYKLLIGHKDLAPSHDTAPVRHWRVDLLDKLFFGSDASQTDFIAPDEWTGGAPDVQLGTAHTYGHEAEVLRSIAELFFKANIAVFQPFPSMLESDEANSLIAIGSGTTNKITRHFLGTPDEPNFRVRDFALPYGIIRGTKALRRRQYGKIIERNAHAISDSTGRLLQHPEAHGHQQTTDYLLVTRIPSIHKGATVTLFSGLHGPASRATELLWTLPTDQLDILAAAVEGSPFYQAVFRASDFRDLGETRNPNPERSQLISAVPTKLELVTDKCPPRRIDVA